MPDRAIPCVRPPGHRQIGSNPNCRFGLAVSCNGAAATAPSGSHSSQMRHRANMSKERARASAEHMRHMRHMQHKPAPTP